MAGKVQKIHARGFGFRVTAIVLASVSITIAICALIFGLIGWRKGAPLK